MKKIIVLMSLMSFLLEFTINAQNFNWAKQAGGAGSDQGYDMGVDASGNVYVCGWFSETAQFGTETLMSFGMQDIFIASYDSAGVFRWVRQAGGLGNELSAGIVTNSNGTSYITGWFSETVNFGDISITSAGSYDMFIAKYNSSGEVQWVESGGGPSDDYGNRIALGFDGNVCVSGSFRETINIGDKVLTSMGDRDILLAHYSSDGKLIFAKSFGGTGEDRGYGIYQDFKCDFFLTGFYSGTAYFDEITLVSPAIISSYILKMNSEGNFQWVKSVAGHANDFARGFGIAADGEGNIVATGFFSGSADIVDQTLYATGGQFDFDVYLVKFDDDGILQWAQNAGSAGIDHGRSLSVNSKGEIFLSGFFTDIGNFGELQISSAGMSDVFVVKYNSDGSASWAINGGGVENDYGYGIVNDAAGSVYITGVFESDAIFGATTLKAFGGNDIFLAKIPSASSGINIPVGSGLIRIFPNPAGENISISLGNIPINKKEVKITILNETGSLIMEKTIRKFTDDQIIQIKTKRLKPGLYILQLNGEGISCSGKFLIGSTK